jgi:hypothetical protein
MFVPPFLFCAPADTGAPQIRRQNRKNKKGICWKIPSSSPILPTNSMDTFYCQPCFKSNNNVAQTSYFLNNLSARFAQT